MIEIQTIKKWLPVLGCFLVFLYSWRVVQVRNATHDTLADSAVYRGPILSFGVYQEYYQNTILSTYSESCIAWIGTFSCFLLFFVGILTGPIYDHGNLRWLLAGGSFCIAFGVMMTSLSDKYYQIFLTQSVLLGAGAGMIWVPCNSFIAARFCPEQRALAIGIATSGSSIGGVIFPIVFRNLQPSIGFGWAVRSVGFLVSGVVIIAFAIIAPIQQAKSPFVRSVIDTSAFKELPFMLLAASGFFSMMAYYVSLVYLPTFTATHIDGPLPDGLSFYILSLANGASTFSRISAGLIAAKAGPLQTYLAALGICAILAFSWIAVHTVSGIIVWTILWGATSGLIASLPAAIIPLFTPNLAAIGTRMGMAMFPCGLGALVGGPIGGVIIGVANLTTRWWPLQVLIGLSMIVAMLLCTYPLICLLELQAQRRLRLEKAATSSEGSHTTLTKGSESK